MKKKSRETEVSEKDTMRLGHGRKERQLLLLPSLSLSAVSAVG